MPAPASLRQHDRHRVVVPGTIRLPGGRAIPCMVQDVSAAGAKLRLPLGFEMPADFELLVPELDIAQKASIAWRSEHSAGVSFSQRHDVARLASRARAVAGADRRMRS